MAKRSVTRAARRQSPSSSHRRARKAADYRQALHPTPEAPMKRLDLFRQGAQTIVAGAFSSAFTQMTSLGAALGAPAGICDVVAEFHSAMRARLELLERSWQSQQQAVRARRGAP